MLSFFRIRDHVLLHLIQHCSTVIKTTGKKHKFTLIRLISFFFKPFSKITGNHNLTQLHLDTALGQCQSYILLNSTLERENPDVTSVIVNLCPNNCSNKGVCSSGKQIKKINWRVFWKNTIQIKSLVFSIVIEGYYVHVFFLSIFKETVPAIMDLEEVIALLTCYLLLQF